MKKILLTMFLLSISSHASAKEDIWLCNSRNGIDVFKIDTNWPLNTAQRINNRWKKLWFSEGKTEVENIIYDSSNKQIRVIYNPVVTEALLAKAKEPVSHPWFNEFRSKTISRYQAFVMFSIINF